jgi:hypothetical protein
MICKRDDESAWSPRSEDPELGGLWFVLSRDPETWATWDGATALYLVSGGASSSVSLRILSFCSFAALSGPEDR